MKPFLIIILLSLSSIFSGFAQNTESDSTKIDPDNLIPDEEFSATDSLNYQAEGFMNQTGWLLWQFDVPCHGKVISRYGPRRGRHHAGIDLKMPKGDTIFAAFDGIVTRSQYYYGYGNLVVIDHGYRIETYYGHLSGFIAHAGDTVKKRQPIGLAGATGRATTSHLHFEIRENRKPYNPELAYDFETYKIRDDIWSVTSLAALTKEKIQKEESVAENMVSREKPESHIVRYGDSLWKIARFYGTTIAALCRLNNLSENAVLNLGMKIKLK
jgi:hypothetical protein